MASGIRIDDFPPEPAWEVARLFPAQGTWSVDDYLELSERHNRLIEFTDGTIEILPMPTYNHQQIVIYFFKLLEAYLEGGGGRIVLAPFRVQLREGKYREPDLAFMAADHLDRAHNEFWDGADLVVEVISEAGRARDVEVKRQDYALAGIPEYWIVDPRDETITVLVLRDGLYMEAGVFGRGERAASVLLTGFSIDAAAVFDRNLI
jgi:Uma2 family endonuclease